MNVKIVLVDDHSIVLEGLHSLLNTVEGFEVVGEATCGKDAITMVDRLQPGLVVLDIGLPDLDGIEVARKISAANPRTKILALSMHNEREYVTQSFKAGVSGYLVKNTALRELVAAIKTVMEGKRYLSSDLVDIILSDEEVDTGKQESVFDVLSVREKEILEKLLRGETSKEIAYALDVSPKTIDAHRQHIMKKLNIDNLIELTRLAIREGLLKP